MAVLPVFKNEGTGIFLKKSFFCMPIAWCILLSSLKSAGWRRCLVLEL